MPTSRHKAPDPENPAWTAARFARAKRLNQMPAEFQRIISKPGRGAQIAPTKDRITVRLSHEVTASLRASGDGWQTRLDSVLKKLVKRNPAVFAAPLDK
jgi:uncharacterized protein (DUF4415 family)